MSVFRITARTYDYFVIEIEANDAAEANQKAREREIGWEMMDGSEWEQLDEETHAIEPTPN